MYQNSVAKIAYLDWPTALIIQHDVAVFFLPSLKKKMKKYFKHELFPFNHLMNTQKVANFENEKMANFANIKNGQF
ncbi:mitochondrial carrier protein [Plasmodium yoelii yoelii]|uniref:Mitochondrial carrier protein n=1 Tax=Plasmodium yoelii yoelii TaxID=73239 RepID=A0AAE9WMD3_PLAYO|nr:mitochondrial carrier protein [Plasmodium yoelii yoelii]